MINGPGRVILHAGGIKIMEYVSYIDRLKIIQQSGNIALLEVFQKLKVPKGEIEKEWNNTEFAGRKTWLEKSSNAKILRFRKKPWVRWGSFKQKRAKILFFKILKWWTRDNIWLIWAVFWLGSWTSLVVDLTLSEVTWPENSCAL